MLRYLKIEVIHSSEVFKCLPWRSVQQLNEVCELFCFRVFRACLEFLGGIRTGYRIDIPRGNLVI